MAFTSLSNIATGGKRLLFSPCIPHCPRNSTPINHQGEGNRYSPDLTSRPNWWPVCCADAQTKGTHYQKRGTTRFFSGRPNATGFMSHANSPCHGIYGFSDWKEIYFKQYYLFPLSFLFLVCSPAIYNLETCHSNGVFSLLRAERPILSEIYWPILSVSETPLSTKIPLLTQNLSRHAGMH